MCSSAHDICSHKKHYSASPGWLNILPMLTRLMSQGGESARADRYVNDDRGHAYDETNAEDIIRHPDTSKGKEISGTV